MDLATGLRLLRHALPHATSALRARTSIAGSKNRSQHTRIPAAVNDRDDPQRAFVQCVRDEIFPHHMKSQWTGGQVKASVPDVR